MTNWPEFPLEECLEVLIDYRGKSPIKSKKGIPVISAKVVKNGTILHPIEQTIDPSYYNVWMRRGIPQVGDVVLTTEGPLGEVAQLDETTAGYALGQRIVTLRGRPNVLNNRFLKFLLMSNIIQQRLCARATGTTVLGISQKALREMPIPLPPYSEQVAIAELLGSLDDKIELNRRMNETLEAMAQAIFRDWFVDFGPTRRKLAGITDPVEIMGGLVQDASRAAELAKLFPDGLDDSGLPEGWTEKPLGEIVEIVGGSTPSTKVPEYWNDGVHPWATPKDLSNNRTIFLHKTERKITDFGLQCISSGLSPAGSVLLSSRAPIGYLAIADKPTAVNQGFIVMRPSPTFPTEMAYLWCQANMDLIKANANGSTFQEISKGNFRRLVAIYPTPELVSAFVSVAKPLFAMICAREQESETLAATRDLLLPKLMSGEIRLREAEKIAEAAQ